MTNRRIRVGSFDRPLGSGEWKGNLLGILIVRNLFGTRRVRRFISTVDCWCAARELLTLRAISVSATGASQSDSRPGFLAGEYKHQLFPPTPRCTSMTTIKR